MGFDLRSRCQNEITHQESRISVDGSDATKTNFMQPELYWKISVSPARPNDFIHVLDDETRLAANRARRRGI
jgi:phage tail sheath protein FI